MVWSVERLRYFLLGKKFFLKTDHQPLVSLFSGNLDVSRRASQRIARWSLILAQYDFELMHVAGSSIPHVDALSRLPISVESKEELVFFERLDAEQDVGISQPDPELARLIGQHFNINSFYRRIVSRIVNNDWRRVSRLEHAFFRARADLSVENGLIYYHNVVFREQVKDPGDNWF